MPASHRSLQDLRLQHQAAAAGANAARQAAAVPLAEAGWVVALDSQVLMYPSLELQYSTSSNTSLLPFSTFAPERSRQNLCLEVEDELDGLLAEDCPFCGQLMIDAITKPFLDPNDEGSSGLWGKGRDKK